MNQPSAIVLVVVGYKQTRKRKHGFLIARVPTIQALDSHNLITSKLSQPNYSATLPAFVIIPRSLSVDVCNFSLSEESSSLS